MPRRVKFEVDERWKDGGREGRGFRTNDGDEAIRMVEEFEREGAFNPNKYRSKRRTKRRDPKRNRRVNFPPEITTRNDNRSTRRSTRVPERSTRRSTRSFTRSPSSYSVNDAGDGRRKSSPRRSTIFQPSRSTMSPRRSTRFQPRLQRENPNTRRRNPHTRRRNPHTRKRNPHTLRRNPHTRRRTTEFIQISPNKKMSSQFKHRSPRRNKYRGAETTRSPGRSTQPTQNIITMDMKRSLNPGDLVPYFVDFILGISVMEVDDLPSEKLSYLDLVMKFKNRYKGKRKDHFWENTHSTIQWIFPTNTRSKYADDTSPILPRSNRDFISLYGQDVFKKIGATIEYASKFYYDYVIRYKFLGENFDHNFLRIARVANCLKYFGKNKTAKRFLRSIISEAEVKNRVNQESHRIWSDILKSL